MKETKSGVLTSEFWVLLVIVLVNAAKSFGLDLGISDSETKEIADGLAGIDEITVASVSGMVYIISRSIVKK